MRRQTRDLLVSVGTILAGFAVIAVLVAMMGCATTGADQDSGDDHPFTERPAPVWTPPDLDPEPPYPDLQSEDQTPAQVQADLAAYLAALASDHLTLKAALVEIHHLYRSLVEAVETTGEGTSPH